MMAAKQPQVVHGKQPAAQPRVVSGGPLGETLIREAHTPSTVLEEVPVPEPEPGEPEEPQG